MLGVSGLRGIVGESLTPEVAVRYAAAFGAWLSNLEEVITVAVSRDGRQGGEKIQALVMDALKESGIHVLDAGVMMTPSLAVFADSQQAHGVQITASHNPQEWNGIKLLINEYAIGGHEFGKVSAAAPPLEIANAVIDNFKNGIAHDGKIHGGIQHNYRRTDDGQHAAHVRKAMSDESSSQQYFLNSIASAGYTCVVDSVNCSGSDATWYLMEELGCRYIQLHGDNSGIFPHTPEPTAENLSGEGGLCDAVPGLKADVGFAQDPDGDRLAIVDEKGRYIGEEYTLVLAAMSILEARSSAPPPPVGELSPKVTEGASARSPSDRSAATSAVGDGGGEITPHPDPLPQGEREEDVVICVNLSTSRMIDDVAARYGARVVRTAVGEANVVEAMKRLRKEGKSVILGGEGNGGVIWPEVTYVRDSLGAMALTLSLMARTGKTVSELVADVPSYAIVKRKQPLARKEDATPTVEKLAAHYRAMGEGVRVDTQDGVRIDFDADRSWVHVRASNTEPILRLIGEAPTPERAEAVLDEVQRLVDAG